MADGKIQVGRMEHYAIYIALVISMVTTFLLGVLLTESLFGTGLNYFGRLSEDAKIGKASASQVNQEAVIERGKKQQNVSFNGGTSFLTNLNDVLDGSIIPESSSASGTNLTGLFKYDVNATDQDASSIRGSYRSDGTIQLSAGNYDFKVIGFDINVWNDVPCDDFDPFDPFPCTRPPYDNLYVIVQRFNDDGLFIDLLVLRLWDNSGTALTSDALPQTIDLNDWDEVTVAAQGWSDQNPFHIDSFWSFGGPVTKLNW